MVREQLGAEPDPCQDDLLRAFGRRDRLISMRSAHGVGKTTALAWAAIISLVTRFPQRTAITAPTTKQLEDALYAEIRMWFKRLPQSLQSLYLVKNDIIQYIPAPEESYLTVRVARPENPEALQGIHSDGWVLLMADEASGVPEKIFEAAGGSMSGHNATTILAGNPVRTAGLFFDTHHSLQNQWTTFHVSAFDSPRVSKEYIRDMAARYGEESNAYRVRVLGEFPLADEDTIIPWELVETARLREIRDPPLDPIIWGLDIAGSGPDRTTLCKRGPKHMLEPIKTWSGLNTMQVTGRIKQEWDDTRPEERPVEILADVLNMGAGVVHRLQELGVPCVGINVSESPAMKDRFKDMTTELWWAAREWFERRDCVIMDDDKGNLSKELTGREYRPMESSGTVKAESKREYKKRLGRSPDLADAFVLTFAGTAATAIHGGRRQAWDKPIKRKIAGIV